MYFFDNVRTIRFRSRYNEVYAIAKRKKYFVNTEENNIFDRYFFSIEKCTFVIRTYRNCNRFFFSELWTRRIQFENKVLCIWNLNNGIQFGFSVFRYYFHFKLTELPAPDFDRITWSVDRETGKFFPLDFTAFFF